MRSKLDTKAPHKPQFLQTRSKQKLLGMERQANIRQENSLLVRRLLNLKQSFLGDVRFLSSLNRSTKERNKIRIRTENSQIVRRLLGVSSDYNCRKTLQQTARLQILSQSISKHRSILDVSEDFRHLRSSQRSQRALQSGKTLRTLRSQADDDPKWQD